MEIITPIRIDMQRTARPPEIYAKQGDACTHKVQIELCDGGAYWQINTRHAAAIRFCKRDGTGGIYNKLPDGSDAYEFPAVIPTDTIIITLAPEVLTCPGDVLVDVAFSSGVEVLATFNFVVHVQAAPMAGVTASNNYYNYQSLADINKAIDEAKAAAAGAVKSINGSKPDSSGNVNVVAGVAKVNGKAGNVSVAVNAYTTCSTAASTAAKTAELVDGFAPVIGAILAVRFTNNNTAESPRLNYDGIEYIIRDRITAQPIKPGDITAGLYRFMLISGAWILLDKLPSEGTTTPAPGDPGEDGGYWIPAVDEAGNLTWSASKAGMGDAPAAANISGPPGKDGGYYIPKISQSGSNIMQLTFDPSEPGMTSVQARQIVLPKGDPGQDGTSPTVAVATITGGHRLTITDAEGSKSADILDGVTPALQIGAVATLDPGSAATASITGTPAAPILNLGIPRGADAPASEAGVTSVNGQSGSVALALPGLGTCSSEASAQIKSISVSTAGFEARDGALLAVKFNNFPNTANGPVLEIGSKSYPVVSSASYNPPKAAALFKAVHLFILAGQAAILLDPADFAAAVEEGLAV